MKENSVNKKRNVFILLFAITLTIFSYAGTVDAKDYWVYTDNNTGSKFYVDSDHSDFRKGFGDKHMQVKIVRSNGDYIVDYYNFGYDEGYWWYSLRGKKGASMRVDRHPFAQAILAFGLEHWTKEGFVE